MATYATNIPALQALASGVADTPANAIVAGDALNAADVVDASRQHKNRKRLAKSQPPLATDNEVADSKRRKHGVESCNFDGDTPLWAQQMQQQMQQMQHSLERRMVHESQRSMNRSIRTNDEDIVPVVRITDGLYPVEWFPQNLTELSGAQGNNLSDLIGFYGLAAPGANVAARRAALKRHLGINL